MAPPRRGHGRSSWSTPPHPWSRLGGAISNKAALHFALRQAPPSLTPSFTLSPSTSLTEAPTKAEHIHPGRASSPLRLLRENNLPSPNPLVARACKNHDLWNLSPVATRCSTLPQPVSTRELRQSEPTLGSSSSTGESSTRNVVNFCNARNSDSSFSENSFDSRPQDFWGAP